MRCVLFACVLFVYVQPSYYPRRCELCRYQIMQGGAMLYRWLPSNVIGPSQEGGYEGIGKPHVDMITLLKNSEHFNYAIALLPTMIICMLFSCESLRQVFEREKGTL